MTPLVIKEESKEHTASHSGQDGSTKMTEPPKVAKEDEQIQESLPETLSIKSIRPETKKKPDEFRSFKHLPFEDIRPPVLTDSGVSAICTSLGQIGQFDSPPPKFWEKKEH